MRRPSGFSIHVIHPNGAPAAVGFEKHLDRAQGVAEETARATGLEVRVWQVRRARVVYMVPAATAAADFQEVA
jgi:hypothetical protein